MDNIYYFCPDFTQPSAGTKRLYRHVCHLNNQGLKAYIVHYKKGFVLDWHGYKAPVVWAENSLSFSEDDILVFPEVMPLFMKQTKHVPCTKVVIALCWSYIYNKGLPNGESWRQYGITEVITPSPVIKRFVEWSMGLNVTLLGSYIDHEKYYYQEEKKKTKIALLTRKDSTGEIVYSIFQVREKLKGWEWALLKGLKEEDYAKQIVESTLYLATSEKEGIPTAVLEAMASGCMVVGYSGIGGNDYMVGQGDKQNCILVENGNLPLLAETLEKVATNWERDYSTGRNELIIKNAIETAKQFCDFEKESRALKDYFQGL